MEIKRTNRGFQIIEFIDRSGQDCILQQSSLADFQQPGTSAIWFGTSKDRMHLDLNLKSNYQEFIIPGVDTDTKGEPK
jgi:hypothetical protein